MRRDYQPRPVRQHEEVTDLVGLCLWDVFSDNHDVITVDGRVADIGSFRGAGAFLDEYLNRDSRERWRERWTNRRPRQSAPIDPCMDGIRAAGRLHEYEERTGLAFQLERLTKRVGHVIPGASACAARHGRLDA